MVDVRPALDPDAPLIRDDVEGKPDNHCFDWETGDAAETAAVFARAEVTIEQEIVFPRVHPAPLETCGAVADYDRIEEKLTLWCTTQAPHAHRTLYADFAGIPEHRIRVDLARHRRRLRQQGADLSRLRLRDRRLDDHRPAGEVGRGPHREPHRQRLRPRLHHAAARSPRPRDGKILAVRSHVLADHGAFNGTAAPMQFPGGFFGVFTGSYDLEAAYCSMTAVHTNKAPGGVAYACSFRIAEAVYLVERLVDLLADELGVDPVELRLQNFIRPEQFPYTSRTGWIYDSGDYETTMREALRIAGYDELRREQAEKRERAGEVGQSLMGIGVSFFTEAVGAGPRETWTWPGSAWPTAARSGSTPAARRWSGCRCRPRARATRRRSRRSSPRRSASTPTTSTSSRATPTTRRTASAPTAAAPRRSPARPPCWSPARSATRPG